MCVVSFIGGHFEDKFKPKFPDIPPYTWTTTTTPIFANITREEFESLKKEVEDMKALLIKAKIYDEQNNEPNCEMESKVAFLKEVAKFVGIDLEDVFKSTKNELPKP